MTCEYHDSCTFFESASASIITRIKYASAFPYCKGGRDGECAIAVEMSAGRTVPQGLLPTGEYDAVDHVIAPVVRHHSSKTIIVIDDSPIFVRLAMAAVQNACSGYDVISAASLEDARQMLEDSPALVVTGYGVGGGRTVHDVVALIDRETPVVVFTGKPNVSLPTGAVLVEKTSGASALADAARTCLSCA